MSYVIRFAGMAGIHIGPGELPEAGDYLAAYDPDANDGRGAVTWTPDWEQARLFDNHKDAFDFWRQQSKVLPIREDGKPNRPLTACSIEVTTLDRAVEEPWGVAGPRPRSN